MVLDSWIQRNLTYVLGTLNTCCTLCCVAQVLSQMFSVHVSHSL